MGNKLYIGNLSFSVSSEELEDLFSTVGEVSSAKVITDRESGRSKGFAFVEMANESQAQKCIEKFHGSSLANRQMSVMEARPMVPRNSMPQRNGFRGSENRSRF